MPTHSVLPLRLATAVAFGPFVLDEAQSRQTRDGQAQTLTGHPLAVLARLAANSRRTLSLAQAAGRYRRSRNAVSVPWPASANTQCLGSPLSGDMNY